MRLKQSTLAYLSGEQFSNGLAVEFDWDTDDAIYRSRIDWLTHHCTDKQVIHAGCVDHSLEQIAHKLKRGKWVHDRLVQVSRRCLGIDNNQLGIDHLRNQLGYNDVACLDLLSAPGSEITGVEWDYLILGEVLEHIDNPVDFLQRLQRYFSTCVGKLIITVPNAFARENYLGARRNVEAINTDHRFWFTPYTLCKVLIAAGLTVDEIRLGRNGVIKKRTLLKNAWFSRHPMLRNNIVAIASW